MERDWEPIPASELGEDDPRDLLGAAITLTEDSELAGADAIAEQAVVRLLEFGRGDEVTGWSDAPVSASFTHGQF
ncbi:hypothetical protein [Streptacidiphilus fuscans]|uniref:Uncharacterized protein n=1 Tax=Streptacidiphilus fuscans TaxID=2789292 RepID=A0A931FGG7_9ACTN|nr:hypothetical protein [Streptacidiphilus fuscans]MBF9073907.1 hypothetical protein [Streptacidiphilus fuscans]